MTEFDDLSDWDDESDLLYEYEIDDPCLHCGPGCENWLGDNLCDLAIQQQVEIHDDFFARFVSDVHCPVCGKELQQVSLPTDGVWVWPGGDWDFAGAAMLGLMLFGSIQTPKGVLHKTVDDDHQYVHVWVFEEGDAGKQLLLKLLREDNEEGRCDE